MQAYYITLNWDRMLFYDGYFIRYNDGNIIGYTRNNSIIAGNNNEFNEFQENGIIGLGLTDSVFRENEIYDVFTLKAYTKMNRKIIIKIKKLSECNQAKINSQVMEILPRLSSKIQNILLERYLSRG